MIPLLNPTREWYCPNCKLTSTTREAQPHTRYHTCVGLGGLTAPMIQVGSRAKVTAVDREDYIGKDRVGRTMAVRTERPDGSNDVAVFAPLVEVKVNA